jgi:hypothetical protein
MPRTLAQLGAPPCRAARVGEYRQYRETPLSAPGTRSDKDIGAGALPQSAERGDLRLRAGSRAWIGDRASSYTFVVSKCSVLRLRGMGAT